MQPWDNVLIKLDSNDANKGRAGVVQEVDNAADPATVTILLDATQGGKAQEVAKSKQSDVTVLR
jgi:hypothetical protein